MAQATTNGPLTADIRKATARPGATGMDHVAEYRLTSNIASIFTKLELHSEPDDNRRVLAVLGWLESS